MIFPRVWTFFTKSVRRQLIWGVVLVHTVLMTLFIWDVTIRQQRLLLDQQINHATALAHSVSTSSGGWLLSRDVTGLQEIIDAQIRYPELLFAMAIDQKGLVLAHTDRHRRGQFVLDLPTQIEPIILNKTPELVDILSPAIVAGKHVGWIRIGIGQVTSQKQLVQITYDGTLYALAAIIIGMILASVIGTRLTKRLYEIQSVATDIEIGKEIDQRVPEVGLDETAQLAKQFNKMLDTLEKRKTERVNAEDRLQQLAENINEVFWLGSPDWNEIFYISPAFEKIWGQRVEALYQHPRLWIESVYKDDIEQVLEDIPKDMGSINDHVDFREYRIQKPGGQIVWIKARAYAIVDDDGELIRIAGIAEDVTERIEMEEAIRRTQKMDALGKLTGGIAHDFNNMLGVILGYTELLGIKLADTPQLKRYIDEINLAGNRAKILTSKLLAFSRKQPTNKTSSNINRLLERDKLMLEKTLTATIKLTTIKAEGLWDVSIDEELLTDSILNMCINSMHAMPEGGELTLSSKNIHLDNEMVQSLAISAGDYVQLSVSDTGTGMSPDTKDKIFEPFFSTKGEAGTGLGMSQVYGFVTQSGGEIQVLSEVDKGTEIVIYLPRLTEQKSDKNDSIISHEKSEANLSCNETILIVDDEPALCKLTEEVLQSHNYQVFSAESGVEALEILSKETIDLLITDVIMPNMDGFELAAQVKKSYPDIKILIASGYNERLQVRDTDKSLYQQLEKPYRSIELLNKVRSLLDE